MKKIKMPSNKNSFIYEFKKMGIIFTEEDFDNNLIPIYYHETNTNPIPKDYVYNQKALWVNKDKDELYFYLFETNMKRDGSFGDLASSETFHFKNLYEMEIWIKVNEPTMKLFDVAKNFCIKRNAEYLDTNLLPKLNIIKGNKI